MTRKDYKLLADVVVEAHNRYHEHEQKHDMLDEIENLLADELNRAYSNFSRTKWHDYIFDKSRPKVGNQ
jgi:hypothetical protein